MVAASVEKKEIRTVAVAAIVVAVVVHVKFDIPDGEGVR